MQLNIVHKSLFANLIICLLGFSSIEKTNQLSLGGEQCAVDGHMTTQCAKQLELDAQERPRY